MFDSLLNRIIVFLSVLVLILGLFIAGLFVPPVFADTLTDYPAFGVNFETVKQGTSFFELNSTNISSVSTSASSPTLLFNNVYAYKTSTELIIGLLVDGSYYFQDFGPSLSYQYFYFTFRSGQDRLRVNAGNNSYSFGASEPGGSSYTWNLPTVGYITNSNISPGISFGDSFESSVDSFVPLYDGFALPRGYLARITFRDSAVSDNNNITLTSTFGNKSNAITGRFNSSQWYRFINTDLASIVLQYEDLGTKISWTPFGNHTTLGQYENGSFVLSGSSSTQLWVVNPVYQSYQINSLGVALAGHGLNGVLNNNVVINDPYGIIEQIRIFPLSSGLVAGVDGVVNETNEDAYKDVNGSTSGAFTYTDSDGNITGSVPQNGATLVDDTTATSLDILNTIKNAFNDLINRLESIFHPAQGFFNTILGSFNDFVHWLSQLWSWLPSPIVSLIEAVLYISILVGCIKLVF